LVVPRSIPIIFAIINPHLFDKFQTLYKMHD